MIKAVRIVDISNDDSTQQREKINEEIVSEYAEAMKCGAKFPPVTVFHDGAQYWLADGFHRFNASREAGMLDILADVREGSRRDARLFSAGANHTHGQKLTSGDKRRSILVLLLDKEWVTWPDVAIAKHCHCTDRYVRGLRAELSGADKTGTVPGDARKANSHAVVVSELPKKEAISENDDDINPETGERETEEEYANRVKQDLHNTIEAQHEQITLLIERQAASGMDIPEAEQVDLLETIADLRKQVKTLTATLDSVSAMRDMYVAECAGLKKQCAMQAKKITKLEAAL